MRRYRPASLLQRYLSVLSVPSISAFEEDVVRRIQKALEDEGDRLPVRLSSIAPVFGIQPVPIVQTDAADGSIEFDPTVGKFVVSVGAQCRRQIPLELFRKEDARHEEAAGVPFELDHRRLRFTYAHEFAHRFFFVPGSEGWTRALECVTRTLSESDKLRGIRVLGQLEEEACNRIAGRVLVPDRQLVRALLPADEPCLSASLDLFRCIERSASTFFVSRECILGTLKDAVRRNVVMVCDGFVALLITPGRRKGRGRRSAREVGRVAFPIVKRRTAYGDLLPPMPGLGIDGLGEDAAALLSPLLGRGAQGRGVIADVPILMRVDRSGRKITCFLSGWWRVWWRGRAGQSLFIWGQLKTPERISGEAG